jgi:uncharacterized protein
MSAADTIRVLVFAKAPVAGAVKTRLAPRLGVEGAARLHEALVRHTLTAACEAALGEVVLCCAPDCTHAFFQRCAQEHGVPLLPQSAGNLGDRMHAALSQGLADCARVLLVGTDCPALDTAAMRAAAAALGADTDLVFVPAEDGGYALIGARRIDGAVFNQVTWGSADVMQQTRERLRTLGWNWAEQPMLWDVDRPEDLDRLLQFGWPAMPDPSAGAP